MFNRTLLSAGAAVLAAAPAFAGGFDAAIVTPAPAAPVVVAPAATVAANGDWSGFYVGGQLGYGRLSLDDGVDGTDSVLEEDSYNGATYGLHAGYMFDFGRVVVGAEVDFDGSQIEVDAADLAALETDDPISVGSVVRGKLRVGYDAGRFLPYLTAGVAQVRLNSDDDAIDAALEDSYNGQFVGVGAAYQLSDRFMVGAEVLQHRFEDTPLTTFESDVTTVSLRGSIRF